MIIEAESVKLRDPRDEDVRDYVRWFRPGRAWMEWDGPWEWERRSPTELMPRWVRNLTPPFPEPRTRLEIESAEGRHIGWVNSYWIDEGGGWRDCGIVIAEEDAWGRGLGLRAFGLWVDYVIEAFDLPRIGMGTWSGNERMIHLALRTGMREEARFVDARLVKRKRYDAVRWGMTREVWERHRAEPAAGLRLYIPPDWDAVIGITRQIYQVHRDLQHAPAFSIEDARETVAGWLSRPESVVWVWQEADEVVGVIRGRRDGVVFLDNFGVAEPHRGQGIGARMLAALEEQLREAGESDVFLQMVWPGNLRAIDFYRRCGYDLINTFELRKGLVENRRGRETKFLDRRFHLGRSG